jgi:hypothetical protein
MTRLLQADGATAVAQTLSSMHRVMLSDPQVSADQKAKNRALLLKVAQKLGVSVPVLEQGHDALPVQSSRISSLNQPLNPEPSGPPPPL